MLVNELAEQNRREELAFLEGSNKTLQTILHNLSE